MIKDITSIKTGQIWNAGSGATFKDIIDTEAALGEGVDLTENLKGNLLMIRMKNGVTVVLSDLQTRVKLTCSKCLKEFTREIEIPTAEAHFFEEGEEIEGGDFDTFFVRARDMSIDLTEALRQEIILHFPMIPVCSERCKGLCIECKANLNHDGHKRGCSKPQTVVSKSEAPDVHKPFANLKDIIQN